MEPVTESEVATALKRLNNNKAVDIMGLTSEHFKIAGQEIIEFLVCLLNYIIASKSISIVLKEGMPPSTRKVIQPTQATTGVLQ